MVGVNTDRDIILGPSFGAGQQNNAQGFYRLMEGLIVEVLDDLYDMIGCFPQSSDADALGKNIFGINNC